MIDSCIFINPEDTFIMEVAKSASLSTKWHAVFDLLARPSNKKHCVDSTLATDHVKEAV
jgi:hypothetical protein